MDLHLFKRVIVGSWDILLTMRRVFDRNYSYVEDGMLWYDQEVHHFDCRGDMFRYPPFLWDDRRLDREQYFLAGHCVGACCVLPLLVRGHVYDCYYFANLSIPGGRFPLTTPCESRQVGDGGSYLGKLMCKASQGGAEDEELGWPKFEK